jgi:Flp pilus assembly protein TadB
MRRGVMDDNPYEAPQTPLATEQRAARRWRVSWRIPLVILVGVVLSIYAMRFEPFNIWRVGILLVVVVLVVTLVRSSDTKTRR